MRSSSLVVLVSLAVGLNAGPTGLKRDDATPVLEAREPAFSVNIPNNIPVSGTFRSGVTVTPKTPSGSIVTSNRNSTLFGGLFGRDDATPALAAREPQFSLNIPNRIPVSGQFRNGLTITPQTGGGSIVTGNRNSTLLGQLGSVFPFNFKREDGEATHTIEAREPQFSLNIPNSIPVSGAFRNGLTVTPKVGGGSIVTGNRNSTLFGQLFGQFGFKRDEEDSTPTLQAREPQFSLNIPNRIPVSGQFRNGLTITPQTAGGSIVTGNRNSTLLGQLGSVFPFNFKRDDKEATHTIEAREPQFSINIPNRIPVSGAFRNGLTVTPQTGGGSIVTGNRNSTLFGQLFGGFKRDEEDVESTGTPTLAAREPAFSLNIPNNIPVSGAFRNGLTITPQTPSGSIVTGNNNSTLLGQLGSVFPFSFKREE